MLLKISLKMQHVCWLASWAFGLNFGGFFPNKIPTFTFCAFWIFNAILSAQKKFTPISRKIFLQWAVGEARGDTMLPPYWTAPCHLEWHNGGVIQAKASGTRFLGVAERGGPLRPLTLAFQLTSTRTAYLTPNTCLSTPRLKYHVPKINTHNWAFVELRCCHCHPIKSLATTNLPSWHTLTTDWLPAPLRTRHNESLF